jgi:imidazoleglycerol phosphate synthase glutamine amidotransferase subunit HisH
MIAIIDYGAGNLRSVRNTLTYLGAGELVTVSRPDQLNSAEKIVLPGVGAFGAGITALRAAGFEGPIKSSGRAAAGIAWDAACLNQVTRWASTRDRRCRGARLQRKIARG